MPHRAELDYEGWRLTVIPLGRFYTWWVISDPPLHAVIKHGDCPTFPAAVHEAHRTLQAQIGRPIPKPTLLETP